MTAWKPRGRRGSITTIVLLFGLMAPSPAPARGSFPHDDPWNADHIDGLPPEVRSSVVQMCSTRPNAAHYFATYLDHARTIRLHFEHFSCEGARQIHRRAEGCLHQEFSQSGAHYRLIRNYYGRCDD
ncbi:hypothetical protein ACFFWD_26505 [Bradyrhizobium erythrophlei]|uniref:hypothetical protein n=1 Tax=Bradyrhizobium erythrophlei TaxID=1437360 RepID=UPI0035EB8F0F